MALSLVTPPAAEPVSSAELALHLKIDVSTDDTLIATLGIAAREYVESFTRRKLITQTFDLKLDGFPCNGEPIVLPFPPVSSITSVSYVDTSGATVAWTPGATGYLTDLPAGPQASPARVYPAYQVLYPVTRPIQNAVTVRFVSGYGAASTSVPSSFLSAIKLLVGHWYLNREAAVIDVGNSAPIPIGIDALLWPYRVWL